MQISVFLFITQLISIVVATLSIFDQRKDDLVARRLDDSMTR